MKNIIIITTGGTISMAQDSSTDSVNIQNPAQMRSMIPMLKVDAQVEMEHLFHIPSTHMTLSHMYELAQKVENHLLADHIDGIVITHGTDSLEETAYYLDLTLNNDKPVVITGAMRSHNELGADGPQNLNQAIRVAADPQSKGRGVMVVFHDEIHAAKYVIKTHTSQLSTFRSVNTGPIGAISPEGVHYFFQHQRSAQIPLVPATAEVTLIKVVAGMNASMIEWAIKEKIDGIVIEAFGQGNLPPSLLPSCRKAIAQHIPIVLTSRCIEGRVAGVYDYEGGGKQLLKEGFIFTEEINGLKARIQLILSLSAKKQKPLYEPVYTS